MVFVVGVAFVLASAFVVCLPLFRTEVSEGLPGDADDTRARFEKQKREAYSAIREADMDLEMGKLARADYEIIRAAEEARALEALRALEREDGER
jgi:hypothetical protein